MSDVFAAKSVVGLDNHGVFGQACDGSLFAAERADAAPADTPEVLRIELKDMNFDSIDPAHNAAKDTSFLVCWRETE